MGRTKVSSGGGITGNSSTSAEAKMKTMLKDLHQLINQVQVSEILDTQKSNYNIFRHIVFIGE